MTEEETGSSQPGCKHVTRMSASSSTWRCQWHVIQGHVGRSERHFSSACVRTGHRIAGKWEVAEAFINWPDEPIFVP